MRRIRFAAIICAILAMGTGAAIAADEAPKYKPEDIKKWLEGSRKDTIETPDGIYIELNYWSPEGASANTPVVMLLHDWGQDQRVWFEYAAKLYKEKFAVVTFDFRGHGKSNRVNREVYRHPKDHPNQDKAINDRDPPEIDYKKDLAQNSHVNLFGYDILTVKRFITKENNEKTLNVKCLGVVAGGELPSLIAMQFAQHEYSKKDVWVNQTGDLFAIVLISPTMRYKAQNLDKFASFDKEMKDEDRLPIIMFSKKGEFKAREVKNLVNVLRIPNKLDDKAPPRKEEWYRPRSGFFEVDATGKGTELLKKKTIVASKENKPEPGDTLENTMVRWLDYRLRLDKEVKEKRSWEVKKIDETDSSFGTGR